jgi:hypothetical protein
LRGETASPKRGGDVNGEERNYGMAHGIGFIGLGIMGERMLRTMREHPHFAVAAAWDPDAAAAARLAAIDASARFARDAGDVAGDDKVDCLYIASPPSTHLAYADLAFDHGKAVFAEKPLAVDLASSRAAAARGPISKRSAASRRNAPDSDGGSGRSGSTASTSIVRQNSRQCRRSARPKSRTNMQNRTAGFPILAQEGLPGCGNCAWILLQTATAGRAALMAPYALSFSCDWASLENALKVRKRS